MGRQFSPEATSDAVQTAWGKALANEGPQGLRGGRAGYSGAHGDVAAADLQTRKEPVKGAQHSDMTLCPEHVIERLLCWHRNAPDFQS